MINVQKLKKSDNLCWFRIHDLNSENPFPFSLGKIFPACFAFKIKFQNQIYDPKWLFYCQNDLSKFRIQLKFLDFFLD